MIWFRLIVGWGDFLIKPLFSYDGGVGGAFLPAWIALPCLAIHWALTDDIAKFSSLEESLKYSLTKLQDSEQLHKWRKCRTHLSKPWRKHSQGLLLRESGTEDFYQIINKVLYLLIVNQNIELNQNQIKIQNTDFSIKMIS